MHRSGIHHKLSFLRLFCWSSRKYPFFRGRLECNLVFFLDLVYIFWARFHSLHRAHRCCPFSLFMGPVLKFHSVRTSPMRNFDLYDSKRWSFLFPDTCLTSRRLSEPYFPNRSQDFLHRVSWDCLPLWETNTSESCETQPNWGTIFAMATACLSSLSFLLWESQPFFGFFVWLLINLMMREQTLIPGFTSRFSFVELTLGWMPTFTRRSRASTFRKIAAQLSENGTMVTFASDTSFPRHTSTSWYGWLRRCGGSVFWFLRTILGFVAETATVSLQTLAFLISSDDKYLFLLQHHSIPFDSWPRLLFQFSCVWLQSFVNGVSDLYSSSPLSSIFHNWASKTSDESPCRTIPLRFWVARTHVFHFVQTFQDIIGWNLWHGQ